MEETGTKVKSATLIDANSVVVKWSYNDVPELLHHIGIIYEVKVEESKIKEDADGQDSLGAVWIPLSEINSECVSSLVYAVLLKLDYIK